MYRHDLAGIGLAALLCLLGCTQSGPRIVPIDGTVTHNGEPVSSLMIYFQPASGRPSWAISDKNGHFSLDYDPEHRGAVTGNHTVWVLEDPNQNDPLLTAGKPKQKRSPEMQAILDKYGSAEKSPLKVEITKADRNFQLKLD
jgi:hypothetical protein